MICLGSEQAGQIKRHFIFEQLAVGSAYPCSHFVPVSSPAYRYLHHFLPYLSFASGFISVRKARIILSIFRLVSPPVATD
jgi:hypothetical protein